MQPLTLKAILGANYDETAERLDAQLQPVDVMEVFIVAQIVRAFWRIARCESVADPNNPDIDRIRQRAELSIRRNMASLSQLQGDRHLKAQLDLDLPGLARVKDVLQTSALSQRLTSSRRESGQPTQTTAPAQAVSQIEANIAAVVRKGEELQTANLKIRSHFAPNNAGHPAHPGPVSGRNSPCPCGSRLKHKRCCGKGAAPVYSQAA